MKRLNPETGKPFKRGDIGEDEKIFWTYLFSEKLKNNNFFCEIWFSKERFYKAKNKRKINTTGQTRTLNFFATKIICDARVRCNGKNGRPATNGIVTITKEWVKEKLEKGICEATGDKLTIKAGFNNTASLDRKNSLDPNYTPENSRIVTRQFNVMKNEYSDEEFIRVAEALKNVRKKQITRVSDSFDTPSKKDPAHGSIYGAGAGQDCDGAHHYQGEPGWEDPGDSPQAGGRVSMGPGVSEMGTLVVTPSSTYFRKPGAETESNLQQLRHLRNQRGEREMARGTLARWVVRLFGRRRKQQVQGSEHATVQGAEKSSENVQTKNYLNRHSDTSGRW